MRLGMGGRESEAGMEIVRILSYFVEGGFCLAGDYSSDLMQSVLYRDTTYWTGLDMTGHWQVLYRHR
jgi:hypothetical protein